MAKSCEILAEVTVQGLVYLGKAPASGLYICAASTANPVTLSISPYICSGVLTATELGVILASSDAAQQLLNMALQNGCNVGVKVTDRAVKIVILQAKSIGKEGQKAVSETTRYVSKMNTYEGASWLIRYLSRM